MHNTVGRVGSGEHTTGTRHGTGVREQTAQLYSSSNHSHHHIALCWHSRLSKQFRGPRFAKSLTLKSLFQWSLYFFAPNFIPCSDLHKKPRIYNFNLVFGIVWKFGLKHTVVYNVSFFVSFLLLMEGHWRGFFSFLETGSSNIFMNSKYQKLHPVVNKLLIIPL